MYYRENANNPPLYRLNPSIKILLIAILTILISLSYEPVLSGVLLISLFGAVCYFGKISPATLLRVMAPFNTLALGFVLFMLLTRGLSNSGTYQIWFLKWDSSDLIISLTLGLRIIVIILLSMAFIMTTQPVEFILSLIQNLKVPYVIGYATLTAYRFLPTFNNELQKIRLAQQVRGIEQKKGIIAGIKSVPRYLLPILATAVRRGERAALAMEGRSFGALPKRSYYKEVKVQKLDLIAIITVIAYCTVLIFILHSLGILHLSLGLDLN
jgi:energy-coupling factor transport system permease protein